MTRFRTFFTTLLLLTSLSTLAQIQLPKLISDGMVLQRKEKVKLWGWASPNENISVDFKSKTYKTQADSKGAWQIMLPSQKAGGPYELIFKGKNEIRVKNILFGDVWVCSGQSNMELPMSRVKGNYEQYLKHVQRNRIRQFTVPDRYNFKEEAVDFESGSWDVLSDRHVDNFSAVAYFFAMDLEENIDIPIGIINTALGGSPVEAWMSDDALKAFPEDYAEAEKFKNDALISDIQTRDKARQDAWYQLLDSKDEGLLTEKPWYEPTIDDENWKDINLPGYWKNEALGDVNGAVWFRKEFYVPKSMVGTQAKLELGRIVDQDYVYINGKLVGTTGYQYPPRRYNMSSLVLKEGLNSIAVRVISNSGSGGFVLDKPYQITANGKHIELKGTWKYKLGTTMEPLESQTFIRWKPKGLFNAMIAPLLNLKITGVLWYQGESNTGNPKKYYKTFPALIQDWRNHWSQGDFPFLFVQLANFMESHEAPTESKWAELRQAQLETSLTVPNTGMAVAIDLGEWNDIHPVNKKDVGNRLALLARNMVYGERKLQAFSPVPKKVEFGSHEIKITMKNIGSGFKPIDYGNHMITNITVSNDGKHFKKAPAILYKNEIYISCTDVPNPTVVRYAWSDNPAQLNLYTKEGLPASPFEVKKETE